MMFDPNVNDALSDFTRKLVGEMPEFAEVIREVREAGGTEADAFVRLAHVFAVRPELMGRIETLAKTTLAPLQDVFGAGITIASPSGRGGPRLNPAYEAALAERVQYDGDVPELRTGPMPAGGTPAVSVDTTARNSVAIGLMLDTASESVAEEIRAIEAEHVRLLETGEPGLIAAEPHELSAYERAKLPDPKRYKRGEVPQPIEVLPPDGATLAVMGASERRAATWRFLSTTQGRRSATRTIGVLISEQIGCTLATAQEPARVRPEDIFAHAEWTVNLSENTQPEFAFIDTAAAVLSRKLADLLADGRACNQALVLEIIPINTVDVRRVGWAARLVKDVACA